MRGTPQSSFSLVIVSNQLAHLFGHARSSGFPTSNLPAPKQRKAFAVQADNGGGLHDKDPGLPIPPDRTQPCPQKSICGRQLGPLHRALQDSDLVAQRKNLELERRTAPKRGGKCGMSAVNKCPNGNRRMSDKLQFNLLGIY